MADIPKTLETLLPTWQNILFTAFTRVKEPVFSRSLLKDLNSIGNVWIFICALNMRWNPLLMTVPTTAFRNHPLQSGNLVIKYINACKFYYHLRSIMRDEKQDFNSTDSQDPFILNLDHGETILHAVDLERKSTNVELTAKWTADRFFLSIQLLISDLQSKEQIPRISKSTKHKSKWSQFQLQRPVKLNSVDFTSAESMFIYAVDGLDLDDIARDPDGEFELDQFYESLNAISKDLNKFDIGNKCAICGKKGHTFDGCGYLKGDLRQAHIKILYLCF